MNYKIDRQFRSHFRNLKQVFLYVINKCNLTCLQCIYKPDNLFNTGDIEIPFDTAVDLLADFYKMGARKLTLLGGEPTLYGSESNNAYSICDLVSEAKLIGYDYVRMDTNGIFDAALLENDKLRKIDEISFSIDGYDSEANDKIRGNGSFDKAINNIIQALKLNYRVNMTCCIYNEMLENTNTDEYVLENFIYLAERIKVNQVNFHALVKDGTPIDTWAGDLHVSVEKWVEVYKEIEKNISNNKYKVQVRIPKTFITKDEFESNPEYFGFCPAKLGERVLVHPNGIIRICSGLLCTPYCIADYYDKKIVWNNRKTNELINHKINESTPCTNRSKKDFNKYYPLCFSFKPRQEEFVYKELLRWEEKNNTNV